MSETVTVRTRKLWTCLPGTTRWIVLRQQTSAETRKLFLADQSSHPSSAFRFIYLFIYFMIFRYVKDRRPSISPNFNFLGQLVEFDSQLTKQRTVDDRNWLQSSRASSDDKTSEVPERAPSPSKRPCMIDLSLAVIQSRGKSLANGVTVQSPTTALSRLQFVEQRQATSTAAVKVLPKSATADAPTVHSATSFQTTSVIYSTFGKHIYDFVILTVILQHGTNANALVV